MSTVHYISFVTFCSIEFLQRPCPCEVQVRFDHCV